MRDVSRVLAFAGGLLVGSICSGALWVMAISMISGAQPLLHVVALRFREDLDDEAITRHFVNEVNLKARMPDLVQSWSFNKNLSLKDRKDVNGGCQWVVLCTLYDGRKLADYLSHPQHKDVGRLQGPLITGKFVVDIETK
jgi:hypothetical protein